MSQEVEPRQEDRLVSVAQAARILGLAVSTLYTWIGERRVRSVKLGRRRLLRLSDLRELIAAGTVEPRPDDTDIEKMPRDATGLPR